MTSIWARALWQASVMVFVGQAHQQHRQQRSGTRTLVDIALPLCCATFVNSSFSNIHTQDDVLNTMAMATMDVDERVTVVVGNRKTPDQLVVGSRLQLLGSVLPRTLLLPTCGFDCII